MPRTRLRFPDFSTQQVAAAGLALYMIGFVVSNASYAQYEVTRLDLLQTRYIGAAMIFVIGFGTPFAIGVIVQREFVYRETMIDRAIGAAIIGGVGGYACFVLAMFATVPTSPVAMAAVIAALILVGVFVSTMLNARSGDGRFRAGNAVAIDVVYSFVTLVVSIVFFGLQVYPRIFPAFGGGAAWYGRIGFTEEAERDLRRQVSTTLPNGAAMARDSSRADIIAEVRDQDVIILDRDVDQTTFLMCNRATKRASAVTVATSALRWQNTVDFVNPANASKTLCREPRRAVPTSVSPDSMFRPIGGAQNIDSIIVKRH